MAAANCPPPVEVAGDALTEFVGDRLVVVLVAHAGEIALAVAEAGRSGPSRRRDRGRAHQGIVGVGDPRGPVRRGGCEVSGVRHQVPAAGDDVLLHRSVARVEMGLGLRRNGPRSGSRRPGRVRRHGSCLHCRAG